MQDEGQDERQDQSTQESDRGNARLEGTEGKTAVVALVGRPSVGKSTFLNTACGQKALITSPYPQTTRNAIRAVVNRPQGQLVFIDTPGLHTSDKKMNLHLVKTAQGAIKDSDLVLYMVDTTRQGRRDQRRTPAAKAEALRSPSQAPEELSIASLLAPLSERLVVALSKTDAAKSDILRARAFVAEALPHVPNERVVPVSARGGQGVEETLSALFALASAGPALYPQDVYTDQSVDFRIAEIVRGEAMARLKDEIPHEIYVKVLDMRMKGSRLAVRAALCVERESQKGIVIGRGAAMIKAIREGSLRECRAVFPWNVELELQVKVDKNWRQNDKTLAALLR